MGTENHKLWHCVVTSYKKERLAKATLDSLDILTFAPSIREFHSKSGKQLEKVSPLFPRYVFVYERFSILKQRLLDWRQRNRLYVTGIHDLLYHSHEPCVVDPDDIEFILSRIDDEGFFVPPDKQMNVTRIYDEILPGQNIRIMEGSFQGMTAEFQRMNGDQRCQVMMMMFNGRPCAMSYHRSEIELV